MPIHACACGCRAGEPAVICGCHREIIRLVSPPSNKKGGHPPLKTLSSLSFVSLRAPEGMAGRMGSGTSGKCC